ncbi:MAG: Ig-like domain-containing protein [Halieaceae bacterium]|nr:Ig-like domain-containing protein [Halieaceae bacterium]
MSSPATVSLTVTAVDDGGASATGGDSATTPVNTPVTSTLTVTDPDGLSATPFSIVSPAGDPSNGSVVIDATTGEYTYTPNAGYTGSDSFDVTITDAQGFTSVVTVNITVTAAADAGPATPGVFNETTAEDTALNGSVGTVTDPDGLAINPFSIQAVDEPANGTVVINPSTGAYTYTPDADFNGSDSFDVTVTDADGFTSTVTVNITVTAVDDPVTAAADTNTAAEGGSATTGNVLSNDSLGDTPATVTGAVDDDGDALTLGVAFATDAGGSLTLNSDGSYSYTPPALGLVPAGGVTEVFTYTVEDADGDSDTATLTITVSNVNQDPVITSGASFSVPEGTTAVGQVVATDSDGDTLNYALSGPDAALFTIDGSGNITFVGAPDFETPGDVGSDNTYNVTVSVNDGGPAVTQDLTINVTDVDEGAPSATDDTDTATEGGSAVSGNVLGNDVAADTPITVASAVDDDGDALTLGVAFPTNAGGSLTLNTDGSYSYTPPAPGSVPAGGLTEVFTYTAEDADGDTDTATLTITVNNVNQPPAAVDDDFGSTPEDTAITFAVVDDDTDSDGDTLSVTAIDGTGVISGDTVSVTNGTVTLNGDGTLTFTPAADYSGSISFDYTVSDGALTDTGTVTGTVTPLDDGAASATGGDSATTPVNTAVTSTLTVTDPDGLSATPFSIVSPAGDPSNGSVVIDATTGEYTYTPNAGYTGGDSFDVTITDAQGFTSIVTVSITVTAATDAGPATPGVFNETTPEDTALNGSVGTVTDPDGLAATPFSIQPADQPASGSVVIDATTGAYTYTPTADFAGSDSFVVTVTDADGFTTPVTVNVTVTPLDDGAATATGGDSATTPVNTAVTSTLTVTDPDGLSATPFSIVSPAGDPSNGSVVIDATTGEYTYTPNAGYTGGDSFDVTVTDAQGFTSTVTVNITVTAATDAGPATPGVFNETTPENTALNGSVGTVTDPDGLAATPFSIQPVDQPANGTVVIDATSGAYTYTPTAGFSGSDSFDVTVTDADGFTSTVTVNVTVTAAGNSAPTDIALAGSTVPENAAGAIIGTLTTTDPDVGDTHTYSVSDSRFEVNGLGQLRLRAGQSLDFETEPTVTLSITSTDAGGLSRTENFVITVTDVFEDTTPPAQPTVDSQVTSDTTPVITGTSTLLAGEFLEVTVAGTTYTEASPELSLVGSNWSLTLTTPLADGTYEVVARATDAAGNSIADNTSGELVIDTLAPDVPTVDSQVTNEQAPTITGTVNLATGESLAVTVNGVTYNEGDGALNVVGSDWSLAIPAGDALDAGIYDVIARVVDLAGNESLDATSGELEIDLTPPPAPTVVAQVTNDNTPVIAGTVDLAPGDTLTVVVNGVTYTEGDGQLSVTGTNWTLVVPDSDRIPDGVYNVTASLEDPAGNVSIDPTSAELEIDTVQAQVPTVESQVTNNDRPTLNGTFDANRADGGLVVTVDGVSYELGVSNALSVSGNSWTLDLSTAAGLDDGTYDVSVDTTDRFGVTVSDNTVGELVIDTTPPGAPTVEELQTRVTSPTLVGTASVGSGETLTVTVDGRTYQEGDGFLNLVGNGWTLNVDGDLADGVYDVTATVADAAGNATSDSTVSELTVDTTAPLVSDLTTSYNERSDEGVPLGSVRVSDNIGLAGVGFLWSDGSVRVTTEDGFFTIDTAGNIALTAAGAAGMANDFELGDNAYNYTVVATDTVGLESTSSVVLSLLNIDDATPLPDPDGTQGGPLPDEPTDDRDPSLGSPGPDDRGEGNAERPGISDGGRVDIGDTVREITETADQIWNIVDDRVHLDISLDDRPVTAEGTSEISLPADTFSHDDPFAEIRVSAEMADGRPLPSYVSFDGNTQTFTVDGAEALAEGVTAIDVRVIGSDDQGQSAEGTFTIEVLGDDFTSPDSVAAGDDAGVRSAGSASPAGEERGASAAGLESVAAGESGEGLATATAGDDPLVMLTVNLTEQRVGAEGASTIALPSNTFEHSDPEETIYVEATLQDGGSLPEFVIFDPDTMTFEVDGAAAAEAGQTEISVLLVGRDDAGNSASGVFVISVGSLVEETAGTDALLPNEGDATSGDVQGAAVEIDEASNEELPLEENQAASDVNTAEEPQKQADGRENLDLQLEKASRYTFVEKLEQLLDDIKNLFT